MLFLEPQRTPYDLHFRVFGVPVRVHPMFWLLSALLGWSAMDLGFEYVLLWIACVFISILIHELGHVWMGQVFGHRGHIVLYSFGGLAIGSNAASAWWKRVLVSFAGPLAGFLFLGLVMLFTALAMPEQFNVYMAILLRGQLRLPFGPTIDEALVPVLMQVVRQPSLRDEAFMDLFQINLFWGLINLLPIWPLDGGQISRDVLSQVNRRNGLRLSLGLSFLVAGLLAINAAMVANGRPLVPYLPGGMYIAVMFGLLALQSFTQMQQTHVYDARDPWLGQGRPWERDEEDSWRR